MLDKVTFFAKLEKEETELVETMIKDAYERGFESRKFWRFNVMLAGLLGLSVVLLVESCQSFNAYVATWPESPPEPEITTDVTVAWQPVKKVFSGATLFKMEVEPNVVCYSISNRHDVNPTGFGCVNKTASEEGEKR